MTSFIEVAEAPMPQRIPVKTNKIVMIPENLIVADHLREFPPFHFRPSIDRLKYLIGLLFDLPFRDKRLLDKLSNDQEFPYILLYSPILRAKIHNYQYYLGYLLESGVIETNNQYQVGNYSKGYRLTEKYRTNAVTEKIEEQDLFKNTALSEERKLEVVKNFPQLVSAFDGLNFDKEAALRYMDGLLESELKAAKGKSLDKLFYKFGIYKLMIERVSERDFFFVQDKFSNRLHTILTNIKSDLRKYFSYQGERLASVDLSGSQPFLILNLLQKEFFVSKSESQTINLELINKGIDPLIQAPDLTSQLFHPFMCGSFEDKSVIAEIEVFKSKVKHNEFYEYCGEKLGKMTSGKFSRDQMKKMMFSVIFSSNEEAQPHIVRNKEMFRIIFPYISKVLFAWKLEHGNNLSKVLQKIESHLFLDCIVPRINAERPELPIFTIHDSIVTLASEVDYLAYVMYEEIQRHTGFNPHFKMEDWKVDD